MRWLLLADLVVTVLTGALLLTSPITLSYYQYGWITHVLVTLLIIFLARRRATRLLIGLSALPLPIALLVLPAHFGALDLLLILWTLGALPLISAGLTGQGTQPCAPTKTCFTPEQIIRLLLIGVIAAGCLVSLRSIRDFPNFSATDEAMIYNYIDTFERTGKIEASLIPYPAPVVTGNLYTVAAALWTTVFRGDPFALRNLSAVGGLLLIAVVFATGRALRDSLTGGIAAALLATNLLWMAVSHVGRQEIWLALFVWTAYWLSLEARQRESRWIALLAGLIVALSADVHPLGALACLALGGWWIAETWQWKSRARRVTPLTPADQKQVSFPSPTQAERGAKNPKSMPSPINSRLLMMFIVGGLVGTAYYVCVHVLPDVNYFLAGVRDELVSYGAEGSTPLGAIIARHANYLQSNPLEIGLLLVCALWGLRQREARRLGILIGGLLLLYSLMVADPNLYYPIVWITGLVILAAVGVQTAQWNWRAPLLVAFLAALVLNIALVERHVSAGWNERAVTAIQQVAAHVPRAGRGMSESFVYLALRDPRFISFTFVDIWARQAGIRQWEIVETLQPDWIVTVRDESEFTPLFGILSVDVPHMHLQFPDAALASAYSLSQSIPTSVGDFQIWRRS